MRSGLPPSPASLTAFPPSDFLASGFLASRFLASRFLASGFLAFGFLASGPIWSAGSWAPTSRHRALGPLEPTAATTRGRAPSTQERRVRRTSCCRATDIWRRSGLTTMAVPANGPRPVWVAMFAWARGTATPGSSTMQPLWRYSATSMPEAPAAAASSAADCNWRWTSSPCHRSTEMPPSGSNITAISRHHTTMASPRSSPARPGRRQRPGLGTFMSRRPGRRRRARWTWPCSGGRR